MQGNCWDDDVSSIVGDSKKKIVGAQIKKSQKQFGADLGDKKYHPCKRGSGNDFDIDQSRDTKKSNKNCNYRAQFKKGKTLISCQFLNFWRSVNGGQKL